MNLKQLFCAFLLILSTYGYLKKENIGEKLWEFSDYSDVIKVTDFINSEFCSDASIEQNHDYYVGTLPYNLILGFINSNRIGKSVYYPSPEFGSESRIFYLLVSPNGTTITQE